MLNYQGNDKRGGVCIYFNGSPSIAFADVIGTLEKCLLCELGGNSKNNYITTSSRLPNNQELSLKKRFSIFKGLDKKAMPNEKDVMSVILDNFNARPSTL